MSRSPDGSRETTLVEEGEIRFGPPYYRLFLDGREFAGRIFGGLVTWSPDGRFLAAQEWLTLDYSTGPITRVFLVDLQAGKWVTLPSATKMFVKEFVFADGCFHYRAVDEATGRATALAVDLSSLCAWEPVDLR